MENTEIDIDQIIDKLLKAKRPAFQKEPTLSENEVKHLCSKVKQIFSDQPVLLKLLSPIKVCGILLTLVCSGNLVKGDLFGYYDTLLRIFELGGFPPESNYLFLGNYVDQGRQSIETICLLFAYKIKYPENIFLLRGNHECSAINRTKGFYDECKRRYNIKIWKTFNDVFNFIPIAAIVDDKIFCVHGGLSPDLISLDQIAEIIRPTLVPDTGILRDLLWSDPDPDIIGWIDNDRGAGYYFGSDVVENFLIEHDLNLICRSHQFIEDGYQFFANDGLVTLFPLVNHRGEFGNSGAIMNIDKTLKCSFQVLKPSSRKKTTV